MGNGTQMTLIEQINADFFYRLLLSMKFYFGR